MNSNSSSFTKVTNIRLISTSLRPSFFYTITFMANPMYRHTYFSLMEQLRSDIMSGAIRPGEKLPSENELSQKYSLSRHTVRKALGILEQDGYVEAFHGRGTYCSEKYFGFPLSVMSSSLLYLGYNLYARTNKLFFMHKLYKISRDFSLVFSKTPRGIVICEQ